MVITGEQRIAVPLPREKPAETLCLSLGPDYAGWVLTATESLSAIFEPDGEVRTLSLGYDRAQPVDPRA